MSDKLKIQIMFYGGAIAFAILAIISFPETNSGVLVKKAPAAVAQAVPVDTFKDITIEAKAAYVYDVATKRVLYAKNETVALPLASITKIMTAITATDAAPESTIVTIDENSLKTEGDSGLTINEQWTLKNLLMYTLVVSSNDGAAAIANSFGSHEAFIAKMNEEAKSMGLLHTTFNNESGLDVDGSLSGAYSSAEDTAKLIQTAILKYPSVVAPTRYPFISVKSLNGLSHTVQNTDKLAAEIPGLIAGKTGYSDLAGGNLAVAFDTGINHPVIVVVLGSSYDGRFSDVKKLIDGSLRAIAASRP